MTGAPASPPYRLRTARIELRAFDPSFARALNEVVNRNREHLVPWMPWALALPVPLDDSVQRARACRAEFDRGTDFHFGVFDDAGEFVGALGIHPRVGAGGLEIGYWIDRDRTRRGYAREAAAAATRAGLELLGAQRMHIHVQPDNQVSERIPVALGYTREGIARARLEWPDGTWRDQVVYTLLAHELTNSAASALELEAFDARDARLPLSAPMPLDTDIATGLAPGIATDA